MTETILRFLELLAADADVAEYDAVVESARSAGASREELRDLTGARELATRAAALLAERRRREQELSALFETASDLAALRDVDAVLQAIVHRARHLAGTDVAYMTLADEQHGDTYMRVTSGSVSARFRQLRLGPGDGLGGLVAQTRSPYATADYFADPRFHHTHDIDLAVREEGLVAIVGVPLVLGSTAIGVLFAADRHKRPFSPEELALQCSLADHAAIAIDSADRMAKTQAAVAELNLANAAVRAGSAAVERAAEAHDRLTELVLGGGGVHDIAATVSSVLAGTATVFDEEGTLIGGSAGPVPDLGTAAGRAVFRDGRWLVAVSAGSQRLGTLVLAGRDELDGAERRALERAAMVTALLLLLRRSVTEAEHRVRGELLDDLLAGARHPVDSLRRRAHRLGADLDGAAVVVVARSPTCDRERMRTAAAHLAASMRGLAADRDGTGVLLLPGGDAGDAARMVSARLREAFNRPVTAAGSGPVSTPEEIPGAHREALRCLEAMLVLGREGDGGAAADLGFFGLLLGDSRDLPQFVETTIGPVLDYDRRRGTELTSTLEAYFGCGMNLVKAGERLHIHVNTVAQRMDRITRLLGPGWQSPETTLELQLALRLHRLTNPPGKK